MKIFFELHGLTMKLRDRITEHYKLQYTYNRGIELPHGVRHLMYDAPPYLADDVLYAEMGVHLEGVPPFTVSLRMQISYQWNKSLMMS